ncbi:MAG: LCP family protein [Clostridia bacterium]|nr:LCP family protein [Clostridia bacterium]
MSNQGRNDFGLYERVPSYNSPTFSNRNEDEREYRKQSRKDRRNAIRKRKIKKFVTIVATLVTSFLLISFGCIFAFIKLMVSEDEQKNIYNLMTNSMNDAMDISIPSIGKSRITVLLAGVDEEGLRTDVLMLGTVNRKTNQVDLISIPRDTRITIPNDIVEKYNKVAKYKLAKGDKCKITEYNTYLAAFEDNTMPDLTNYIAELLEIQIDYYAKIDTKSFIEVIDAIGGVEYDVPTRMYYNPPDQDLYINLYPGVQTLTGKQAEALVRDRYDHPNGDFGRMETQQKFLKCCFEQIMDKVSLTNLPALAKTFLKYVDTNFKVSDIPTAISVATNIKVDNFSMHTIPVRSANIAGISYQLLEISETDELIQSIWYPEKNAKEENTWGAY